MIEALLAKFSLSTKIVFGMGILLLIAGLGVKFLWKENTALVATNAVQTQTLKDAGATEALTEKTDAVTEESSVKTVQVVRELVVDQKAVDDEVKRQVDEIKRQYAEKPVTPENTKQRDDSISVARLTGLWDNYCAAPSNKDQASCAKRRNAAGLSH